MRTAFHGSECLPSCADEAWDDNGPVLQEALHKDTASDDHIHDSLYFPTPSLGTDELGAVME